MSLAAGIFLVGLLSCAIPVVIHLWHREKPETVHWPLMQLLMEAKKESRRAWKVRDGLLMALRILLLASIVFAFSRPSVWIRPGGFLGMFVPSSNVIVLDASMSMRAEQGESTRFDVAKKLAKDLARDLQGTRVELLLLTDHLKTLADTQTAKFDELLDAIENARVTYHTADFAAALRTLGERAQGTGHPTDVYLVTDNQATGWADGSQQCRESLRKLSEDVRVSIVTPTAESPVDAENTDGLPAHRAQAQPGGRQAATGNACVAELISWPHEIADMDAPTRFAADIMNFGPTRTLKVRFRVMDSVVDSKSVELAPGKSRRLLFEYQFETSGVYAVEAEIVDESLTCDNRRWLAVDVPEPVPVICLRDGERENVDGETTQVQYLSAFLSPVPDDQDEQVSPLFAPRTVDLRELDGFDDSFRGVFVLANVEKLTEAQADKLTGLVQAGAALAVFLGPDVSAESYNETLFGDEWGLLPVKLQKEPTGDELPKLRDWSEALHVDTAFVEHPVFRFVESGRKRENLLASVHIGRAFDIQRSSLPEDSQNLVARFSKKRPFILQGCKGRVLVFTTAFDLRWGNLPTSDAVILVDRAFRYLASSQFPRRNLHTGQSIVYPREATREDATLTKPDHNEVLVSPGHTDRGQSAYVYESTEEPGVYTLRAEDDPPQRFAVNIKVEESDLRTITEKALRDRYPDFPFAWTASGQLNRNGLTNPRPVEIWWVLICLALLAAVAEIFVAKRLESSPQNRSETPSLASH